MSTVSIEFDFDEDVRESFAEGNVDPPVGARIRVGDTYVAGGSDSYTREFIEGFVIGLLEAGLALLDGERYVLDYYIDEMYLVFEPMDDGTARLAFCYSERAVDDPTHRGDTLPEPEATCRIDQLGEAISSASEAYLETVREYDSTAGSEHVEPLLTELREANPTSE